MTKIYAAVPIVLLMAFFAVGCGSLQTKSELEVTVNPSKSHEECTEMMPRDVLVYSFKSSDQVDFNIHFHEGGNITYPVSKKSAGEEGKFQAEKEQIYCIMWTNIQTTPVRINYTFKLEKWIKTPIY